MKVLGRNLVSYVTLIASISLQGSTKTKRSSRLKSNCLIKLHEMSQIYKLVFIVVICLF
mgnify:CR=1 FL=1